MFRCARSADFFFHQPGAADPSRAPMRGASAGRERHSKEPFFGDSFFSFKKHWNAPRRFFSGKPEETERGIASLRLLEATVPQTVLFHFKPGLNEDRTPETANPTRTQPTRPCPDKDCFNFIFIYIILSRFKLYIVRCCMQSRASG